MSAASPIRAVTFDAGGTLLEPWPSVGHVYAEVALASGLQDVSPALLNKRFSRAWRARTGFRYSRQDWANLVDTIFDGLADPPPSRTFFDALYARFALANCWRVFDDALPAITRLKGRGLRLGVVSNWDERLEPILVNTGLRRHFEVVIVSINEGVRKPDASIFLEAARQLDSPASGVLHVGDSFEEDYQGAKRAGCQAKWLARRVTAERADGVIQSLEEIENCLD